MSNFWKFQQVIENNARLFEDLAFVSWSPKKEADVSYWAEPFVNEFEKKFIIDLASRWVNGEQAPAQWSKKQVALIQRIHSKVKDLNFKRKKAAAKG